MMIDAATGWHRYESGVQDNGWRVVWSEGAKWLKAEAEE